MPTYEFSCHKCELIFEHIYQTVPKNIPKKRKCPKCGKMSEKLLSAGNFHMRGKPHRLGKTEVNNFYNEAIRDSQDRLKLENTPRPYKRYNPNMNVLKDMGLRKLSDKDLDRRKPITNKLGTTINEIKARSKKK